MGLVDHVMLASAQAGVLRSQSPGRCRYGGGDGSIMARCNIDPLFNFAHFHREINDWFMNWATPSGSN